MEAERRILDHGRATLDEGDHMEPAFSVLVGVGVGADDDSADLEGAASPRPRLG